MTWCLLTGLCRAPKPAHCPLEICFPSIFIIGNPHQFGDSNRSRESPGLAPGSWTFTLIHRRPASVPRRLIGLLCSPPGSLLCRLGIILCRKRSFLLLLGFQCLHSHWPPTLPSAGFIEPSLSILQGAPLWLDKGVGGGVLYLEHTWVATRPCPPPCAKMGTAAYLRLLSCVPPRITNSSQEPSVVPFTSTCLALVKWAASSSSSSSLLTLSTWYTWLSPPSGNTLLPWPSCFFCSLVAPPPSLSSSPSPVFSLKSCCFWNAAFLALLFFIAPSLGHLTYSHGLG